MTDFPLFPKRLVITLASIVVAHVSAASAAIAQTDSVAPKPPEIRAAGVLYDGSESPLLKLRVEEFARRFIRVLPNAVYFDRSDTALPTRYRSPLRAQDLAELDALYFGVVNIVGNRLQNRPQATVTLRGERKRAEALRQYLAEQWDVGASRVTIQAVAAPPKAKEYAVEIIGDEDVFAPHIFADTLREISPPIIRFYTKVYNDAVPAYWSIVPKQRVGNQEKTLKNLGGGGKVRPIIDWKINKEKNPISLDSVPMAYQLHVRYDDTLSPSNQKSDRIAVPVERITLEKKRRERLADTLLEIITVMGFAAESSKLNATQKANLAKVRALYSVQPHASVTVMGLFATSERGGKRFAEARAKAVAEALGLSAASGAKSRFDAPRQGYWEPEAAELNHSVWVTIATPARYETNDK